MSLTLWRVVVGGLAVTTLSGGAALLMATRVLIAGVSATGPSAPARATTLADSVTPPDSTVPRGGLFRLTRSPAPLPFDPRGEQLPAEAVEPRPVLGVSGVVLGRSRAALVRGIPGQGTPQVLGEGDELGGVRLVRVDSVVAVLIWRSDTIRVELPRERL